MPSLFAKQFGKRVRELRESRNVSRQALADAIGIQTEAQIGRIERGEYGFSFHRLPQLAEVLGVRVLDLFDFDRQPRPAPSPLALRAAERIDVYARLDPKFPSKVLKLLRLLADN